MTSVYLNRLRKELKEIKKNPIENLRASPKEDNILEWHYVIEGAKDTPYENGFYHGMIIFPKEYPYKPPSIQMITPNGRFSTNTRLCLSMSDFHPESWNPMWSVGTILLGLMTFMNDNKSTFGSIETSEATKRIYAKESLEYNVKNKIFCELFPELVELYNEKKKSQNTNQSIDNVDNVTTSQTINNNTTGVAVKENNNKKPETNSLYLIVTSLVIVIAILWGLLKM